MGRQGLRAAVAACLLLAAASARAQTTASLIKEAERAERAGKAETAIERYATALRLWKPSDGKQTKLRILRAKASRHLELRQWPSAVKELSEAILLEPGSKELLRLRGRARIESGDDRSAIVDLTRAIRLDEAYKEAYADRGFAHERLGNEDASKADYTQACLLGIKYGCDRSSQLWEKGPSARPKKGAVRERMRDASACLAELKACSESGTSYTACVERMRSCEQAPAKGCCPEACRALFTKLQTVSEESGLAEWHKRSGMETRTLSESEAFREVFRPNGSCLQR